MQHFVFLSGFVIAVFGAVNSTYGVAFFGYAPSVYSEGRPAYFADIINDPDSYWSWDKEIITYKLDESFRDEFPNPLVHDQVRRAFQSWDDAWITPKGSRNHYKRHSYGQTFFDIRTITLHEIGHVMGLAHPNQAPWGKNVRPDSTQPSGWRPWGSTGNEVMHAYVATGGYNHLLSHDELDGFPYTHRFDRDFVEVGPTAEADIIVNAPSYIVPTAALAIGPPFGVLRNIDDPAQGALIESAVISFSRRDDYQIGMKTLANYWTYTNVADFTTAEFEIQTRGTDNPGVISHHDNQASGQPFLSFSTFEMDADHKDDLLHRWEDPLSGPIASGSPIRLGLEQDVYDWTVIEADAILPTGQRQAAPLLSVSEWGFMLAAPAGSESAAAHGIFPEQTAEVGRGIRITAAENVELTRIAEIILLPAGGLGLGPEDLDQATLEYYQEHLLGIDLAGGLLLAAGEEFFLILESTAAGLPEAILEAGNYLILDHSELFDAELLIYARSETDDAIVDNFSLLGNAPIVGMRSVPEPAAAALLLLGMVILVARRWIFSRPIASR